MKKVILASLITLMALTTTPVLAAEADTNLTKGQQVKEFANIDIVNTENGVSIILTGTTFNYATKLVNIYLEELFKRSINFGTTADLTITLYPNGFSINIESTDPEQVYEIQKAIAEMNSIAKIKNPLVQLLANHGIK